MGNDSRRNLHRAVRARRPRLEALEGRRLPATFTVVNTDDSGAGSLRDAITRANLDPDQDTIRFVPELVGTIALVSALPDLSTALVLEGPGASALAVARSSAPGTPTFRIFTVTAGAEVTISGLTLTEGQAPVEVTPDFRIARGGGVFNAGTLTVSASVLSDNVASALFSNVFNFASGGGIYNTGTLTIIGSTLSGNQANVEADIGVTSGSGSGGGIFNTGTLTVTGSTISGNQVNSQATFATSGTTDGGGISNSGTLTITDSILSGNLTTSRVASGGGISNSGTLTVTNSTLSGNRANGGGQLAVANGGGISNSGTLTVANSTLSGNVASSTREFAGGGGIFNEGTLTVTSSTLSGNVVSGFAFDGGGGGIFNVGLLTVTNSTLSGNSFDTGSRAGDGITTEGTATVTNSTLSGNGIFNRIPASDPSAMGRLAITTSMIAHGTRTTLINTRGQVTSSGHNLFSDRPAVTLDPTDQVNTDPLLGPLVDNGGPTSTHALLPGSPAIDAGAPIAEVTADQRGVPRPQGGAPDIGAFESRGFTLAVAGGDNQGTPLSSPFPGPLVVAVTSPVGEPVQGGRVTFAAPPTGPAAALAGNPATIGPDGRATVTATANGIVGTYPVTAQAAGAPGIGFSLTNLPVADLSVLAVASPDPVVAGDLLTYTITVSNGGPSTAPAVTLRDALPAGVELVSSSRGGLDPATGAVVADLGDLAAGASATVTIVVRTMAAGTITNTVSATAGGVDPDPLDNQAILTTRVLPVADVSVRQAAAPDPAVAGAPLAYTITVTNTGPDTATAVTLRDALPAGVAFVSTSRGGLDPATGAVVADLGDLAAGASATVTIVVRPPAAGAITNTATAIAASVDPDPDNNTATLAATVAPAADLAVAQAATPDPATATQPTTFALTVTNHGPSPATGVILADVLPAGAAFVSADGGVAPVDGVLSFALGTLAVGEVRTVRFVVRPPAGGATTNVVRVRSDVLDPVAANDVDARDTPVAPAADLAVAQAATPDPAVVGQDLAYTVTVSNGGPDPAAGVVLVNTLPVGAVFISAVAADTGEVTPVGPDLTFNLGSLAVGQGRTIVITVRPAGTGLLFNRAVVGSSTFDPGTAANSSTLRTPVVTAPGGAAGPTVVGLQRLGSGNQRTRLVLTFSAPLGPAAASLLSNYRLTSPGRDRVFGTRDDRPIRLHSAVLFPDARTVTLRPRPRLPLRTQRFLLSVNGTPPGGLTGQDGVALDGDRDGRPGGDFATTFGAEAFVPPGPLRRPSR